MKKTILFTVILSIALLSGCDLFTSRASTFVLPQEDNSILFDSIEGKEFDKNLLKVLFPKNIASTLHEQEDLAAPASRSFFEQSEYNYDGNDFYVLTENLVNPKKTYGNAIEPVRIPASTGAQDDPPYLNQIHEDPTEKGRYFTIDKIDEDTYKVAFVIVKNDTSSLKKVVTIYYTSADSWAPYMSEEKTTSGWETERVYYKDDDGRNLIGDRTLIDTWTGDEAKGAFISPDYSPISLAENNLGVDALFTINADRLYGPGRTGLGYYFDLFWQQQPIETSAQDYSSFTRTLVFDDSATFSDDFADYPEDAVSEQNDYYTEVAIDEYPAVLGIPSGTPGRVKAGMSYYMSPVNSQSVNSRNFSSRVVFIPDPLEIVNANNIYLDENGDFLMKDVKTLEHYENSTSYPWVHRHYYLYRDNGDLSYTNTYYYYDESSIKTIRTAGIDSYAKKIQTSLSLIDGYWEGLATFHLPELTDQAVVMNARLFNGYLHYRISVNGVLYEIDPDSEGKLEIDLPGGGSFSGTVSHSGSLEGTYYPADGGDSINF